MSLRPPITHRDQRNEFLRTNSVLLKILLNFCLTAPALEFKFLKDSFFLDASTDIHPALPPFEITLRPSVQSSHLNSFYCILHVKKIKRNISWTHWSFFWLFCLLASAFSQNTTFSLPEGEHLAVAVDQVPSPRIAFTKNGTLQHANYSSGNFAASIISDSVQSPSDVDIAIDHWGRSHVAVATVNQIQYFYREGSQWIAKPFSGSSVGSPHQICLGLRKIGDSVSPCIAYYDKGTPYPSLKFAQLVNGVWSVSEVDSEPDNATGRSPSLTFDFSGTPHIAYFSGSSSFEKPPKLKYANRRGSNWKIQTVYEGTNGIETGWNLEYRLCEIAIDRLGQPNILSANPSTNSSSNSTIVYSTLKEPGWSNRSVAQTAGTTSVSLSADVKGSRSLLNAAYIDNGAKQIKGSFLPANPTTISFIALTDLPAEVNSITNFSMRGGQSNQRFVGFSKSESSLQYLYSQAFTQSGSGMGFSIDQKIRQSLGIGDPSYTLKTADIFNLETLSISATGVEKLEIFSKAVNLQNLFAVNNKITDLAPLLELPNLTFLDISGNYLDSPQALAQIQQFRDKGVTVITGTQKHPWNVILEPQMEAALRTRLNLSPSLLEPFTAAHAASLTNLSIVYLGSPTTPGITTLRGLEFATNLTSIDIQTNPASQYANCVASLEPISKLMKLANLNVMGNCITDLSPLIELPALSVLHVSGNGLDENSNSPDAQIISELQTRVLSINWNGQRSPWNWILDPALESALRASLGLSSTALFQPYHHSAISNLDLRGLGIAKLDGLEAARNLTYLNLSGNNITDLSPLAGLAQLHELNLSNSIVYSDKVNRVRNLTPLAHLNQLTYLNLEGNEVTDLGPLLELWQGSDYPWLNVSRNGLDEFPGSADDLAVAELGNRGVTVIWNEQRSPWNWMLDPALEAALRSSLEMSSSDAFDLNDHTNVTQLFLDGRGIEKLDGLEFARNLTRLYLRDNNISDLSSLSALNQLQELDISNSNLYSSRQNRVRDLTPLVFLTQLTYLNLEGNELTDLGPLLELWQGSDYPWLNVSRNGLDEFPGSADDLAVAELGRRGVYVLWNEQRSPWNWMLHPALESAIRSSLAMDSSDIFEVADHTNLTSLDLSGLGLENLDGLELARGLISLNLIGNKITDLSLLAGLTQLQSLDISNDLGLYPNSVNRVENLAPLAGLTQLVDLNLKGNQVTDLAPLLELWKTNQNRSLDVSENGLDSRSGSPDALTVTQLENRGVSVTWDNQRSPWNWMDIDPSLIAAIRDQLGISSDALFEPAHHNLLTTLDLSGLGIQNLAGLDLAINLTTLNLRGNNITELSKLAGLAKLQSLNLANDSLLYPDQNNRIHDLTPLMGLDKLTNLDLRGNQITDLEPLLSLWIGPQARSLDLSSNGLDERAGSPDSLAIIQLQKLGVNVVWNNQRSPWNWVLDPAIEAVLRTRLGLEPVDAFEPYHHNSLTGELDLSGLGISKLDGLELAWNLTSLNLTGNNISDLSPLQDLFNLQTLDVSNSSSYPANKNSVEDLAPLIHLSKLTVLNLEGNQVTDLTPLLTLWPSFQTRSLNVSENGLDARSGSPDALTVTQLENRGVSVTWDNQRSPWNWVLDPALETALRTRLGLSETDIFQPFHHNYFPNSLDLSGLGIKSLDGLDLLQNLAFLNLCGNNIQDLLPLTPLVRLQTLNLSNDLELYPGRENQVRNLNPLLGLSQLNNLSLKGNQVTDLSPLLELWKTNQNRSLDVSGNGLDTRSGSPASLAVAQLISRGASVAWTDQRSPWNWILDPALESALRGRLGLAPDSVIEPSHHTFNFASLSLAGLGIKNLDGLELASNVTTLDLRGNYITDIAPLAALSNLQTLSLSNNSSQYPGKENRVRDLSPLVHLSQLRDLYLDGNQVTELSPLLDLWQDNQYRRLSAIGNGLDLRTGSTDRIAITELQSRGVQVSAYEQRSPWNWILDPALEAALRSRLGLSSSASFQPIHHNTIFGTLFLSGLGIESLEGLDLATNVTGLYLCGNNITDLTPLAGLANLVTIDVSNDQTQYPGKENRVRSLAPLINLGQLAVLNLHGNQITDLSPLAGLAQLQHLDLSNDEYYYSGRENRVRDLSPLVNLSQLRELNLEGNQVTDLSPLLDTWQEYQFRSLRVRGNGLDGRSGSPDALVVAQLQSRGVQIDWYYQRSPWNGMIDPALEAALREKLGISPTTDISASDHARLTELILDGNGTIDLNGLEFAENLSNLSAAGRQISDLSALSRLPQLSQLNLQNSSPTNLAALLDIGSLASLDLRGAKVITTSGSQERNAIDALLAKGVDVNFMRPVSNLWSSTENYSGVSLAWTSDPNAQSHTITRKNVKTQEIAILGSTTSNEFWDSSAQAGDIYSYTIESTSNLQKGSNESPVVGFTPLLFSGWLSKMGYSGTSSSRGADPDQDGVPNLVDFAFNLSGSSSPNGLLPVVTNSDGALVCRWQLPKARAGYQAVYEYSSDLVHWSPVIPDHAEDLGTKTEMQFKIPSGQSGFFRVKIE